MKIFRTLFLILTCVGLGMTLGIYLATITNVIDVIFMLIFTGSASGFFLLLTIIFTVVIARNNHARLNLTVSLQKNDTVLQAGVEYVVKKRGTVRPGEYQVLATDENNKSFTVRVNDYVKEYTHNTTLVLSEGDRISARSCNIILR